ncbi:MAG: DUF3572 domain-containing protein [Sphingomonadaceae bacterium]
MQAESTVPKRGPDTLALSALGWVLGDPYRAARLLALTGLTPDQLRDGLGDSSVLGAVLDFLAAHEPDLVAAADALGVKPEELIAAQAELAR